MHRLYRLREEVDFEQTLDVYVLSRRNQQSLDIDLMQPPEVELNKLMPLSVLVIYAFVETIPREIWHL